MQCLDFRRVAFAAAALLFPLTTPSRAQNPFNAWTQEYLNGANESQAAKAVAIDSRGNVIVTGFHHKPSSSNTTVYTVKYDGLDGHIIWEKTLFTANTVYPTCIAIDSTDAVVIAGARDADGDEDIFVMKYNSNGTPATGFAGAFGTSVPVTYNGTADGEDIAAKVAIDSDDNIIVVGRSAGTSAFEDFQILRFTPTGTLDKQERTNVTNRKDIATDVAIGPNNSIVAVGAVGVASNYFSLHLRKLNSDFTPAFVPKTIDNGGDGGAVAVAVNKANGDIFVTGVTNNAIGRGYSTLKFDSAGNQKWEGKVLPIISDFEGAPTSIAIGPDGNPVVTGFQKDLSGTLFARTVKYRTLPQVPNNPVGEELWRRDDYGFIGEDTKVWKVAVDGSNNVIVVGESRNSHGEGNSFINADIYIAKYDGATGVPIFVSGFEGSFGGDDEAEDPIKLPDRKGIDVALDAFGDFVVASSPTRVHNEQDDTGRLEITTQKFKRFIALSGELLPPNPPLVPDGSTFFSGNPPAIGDNGTVAAKILFNAGRKKKNAILVQGGTGGTVLPVVQGGPAPNATGSPEGVFASFSDPVVSPAGNYAFTGKISGASGGKSGVWQSISGVLKRVLRQGDDINGLTDMKFASVTSMSMRNNQLLILGKIVGPGSTNKVLFQVNSAGLATMLVQAGVTTVTLGSEDPSVVKTITILAPPPLEVGDGRWQAASTSVIAKLKLASKRTAICRITAGGTIVPIAWDGLDANGIAATTFDSFEFPALSSGLHMAVLGKLERKTGEASAADDSVLIYNSGTATFTGFARENSPTPPSLGLPNTSYGSFSNPVINTNASSSPLTAFIATLKGSGVSKSTNRAIVYGSPVGSLFTAAQTGTDAPIGPGDEDTTTFKSFDALAQPGGNSVGPIFVAKLGGPGANKKNNLGIFAVSSTGETRRILRTGQILGDREIKSFTLLKPIPGAFSAARSFNNNGSVIVAVTFTNRENALLRVSVP